MHLTVAICTWNRADLLREALEKMTRLRVPSGASWELLVVDNNSADHTDEVIRSFEHRLPIRGLFEPRPGKSHALNQAAREAKGRYILWTDDDALVDEEWLAAYVKAFGRQPGASFFGGPIHPWFVAAPPAWLRQVLDRVANAYALRDLGKCPFRFTETSGVPFGVNFAIATETQRRFLYDTRLGPQPGKSLRGEETRLIHSMLEAGYEGWWVPDAKVRHYVPPERMTISYIRSYYRGYGEMLGLTRPQKGARLFGRPRWLWRRIVAEEMQYHWHRLVSPPEVWIEHLALAAVAHGMLRVDRT